MKLIGYLLTTVLVATANAEGEAKDAMEKVQAGVDVGTAIIDILTDDNTAKFFKNIGNMLGALSPFLGAIGPIISIITMFLPNSPSPELQYMKKEFANINADFDQVFYKFGVLEDLLLESSLKSQYSDYALTILSLSNKLDFFLNTSVENSDTFKERFISEYEISYAGATYKLLEGMTSSSALTDNIPLVAMDFTNNHRKRTQQVMKGVMNLIMQGIKVDLAYYKFSKGDSDYNAVQAYWEDELDRLLEYVREMDVVVRDRWNDQLSVDIDDHLANLYGFSNADFASQFYDFLKEKYDLERLARRSIQRAIWI